MDYEWVGMDRLPPAEGGRCTMPIGRAEYIADMRLTGEALARQVAVDVPRALVTLEGARVRDGAVLEHFVRYVVGHAGIEDAALAMCTQTALAAPMRALSATLLEKDLYLSECPEREPLRVVVTIGKGSAAVNVQKTLRIASGQTLEGVRSVAMAVHYDSGQPYVVVTLALQ